VNSGSDLTKEELTSHVEKQLEEFEIEEKIKRLRRRKKELGPSSDSSSDSSSDRSVKGKSQSFLYSTIFA